MNDIDAYISQFPEEIRLVLQKVRAVIQENAPGAQEAMAYGMPGYKTNKKPLVYFGAFKNHIGFYATPSGHEEFERELASYKQGKGSVQFPLDQPIPYELIARMVKFRLAENQHQKKSH